MKKFIFCFYILSGSLLFAQQYSSTREKNELPTYLIAPDEEEEGDHVFSIVEENPEYRGGEYALMSFIKKNKKNPEFAVENDIQGTVSLSFIIEKDVSLSNIKVIKSPHKVLSDEAIRIVELMPNWKPGKQRGKAVRVRYQLPIIFKF